MTNSRTYLRVIVACAMQPLASAAPQQPSLGVVSAPILTVNGLRFKDLNRNGRLDPYEDWRLTSAVRAADLVARMTLEERAGTAVHGTAPIAGGPLASGPAYDTVAVAQAVLERGVTSLITRMAIAPVEFARQNNRLQEVAERGRLGIPLTISTDPRNHFQVTGGASVAATGFSQWPETLGLGAIGDTELVRRFASIVAREYRAVGIHMALSPQADLATEPRWSRINGTFGEDPQRVRALVKAYVQGMQGDPRRLTRGGVATVVKHWVGYGASVDGFDGHNFYGRYARFQNREFDGHVSAFKGAFEAGVAGVMPTYDMLEGVILDGKPLEQVGAGFNTQLLTDLLRRQNGFRGLVLSDWAITRDCPEDCRTGSPAQEPKHIAMPWGVESLSTMGRFAKGMNAGIDQFGGIDDGAPLAAAVRGGLVTQARLDEAVQRILKMKFDLGLFEDPFVDPKKGPVIVGAPESQRRATEAQARSLVVLENALGPVLLPMKAGGSALFLHGVDAATARSRGFRVVDDAARADVAVIRLTAPFQTLHPGFFFGQRQHEGDLDFKEDDPGLVLVRATAAKVPTIVVVYLDRPAILTSLKPLAKALLADFGISDAALFDALTGRVTPIGRLPFELPASMSDVRAQSPAAPHDSRSPLYPLGYRFSR